MKNKNRTLGKTLLGLAVMVLSGNVIATQYSMEYLGPNASFQGNTATENCFANGENPYPNTSATIDITPTVSGSDVTIQIFDAQPNTFFTAWLRMKGTSSGGTSYGGSPLTGGGATPLAPTTDYNSLLVRTGSGNGKDDVVNGVYTDANGFASLTLNLDFPMDNGAYPFQNIKNFNPNHPRLLEFHKPGFTPSLQPVAIVQGDQGPFTIRVISHCLDNIGHGLTPGPHEPWFDYP